MKYHDTSISGWTVKYRARFHREASRASANYRAREPLPSSLISVPGCDHQTRPHFIHIVAHIAASIPKNTRKPRMIIAMFW